jgi:hypothetical protein
MSVGVSSVADSGAQAVQQPAPRMVNGSKLERARVREGEAQAPAPPAPPAPPASTASSGSVSALSDDGDSRFEKFSKMRRIGIPDVPLREKMRMDGLADHGTLPSTIVVCTHISTTQSYIGIGIGIGMCAHAFKRNVVYRGVYY